MYFHKDMHFTVSRARLQPGKEKEYLDFRRNEVLPQMCAWPGAVFALLLRDDNDPNSFLVINAWARKEDVDKWRADAAEVKLRNKAKTILAGPLEKIGDFTEVHI